MTVLKPWMRNTLGAILLVAVLVGASFGVYALTAPPAPASASATPTTPASTSQNPVSTGAVTPSLKPATIRLTQPATLNGLAPNTDPSLAPILSAATAQLTSMAPNATQTISSFYGSLDDKSLVMLVAFAAPDPDPVLLLDSAMGRFKSTLGVNQTVDVDPGPLGGVARCGDGSANGSPVAICSWADDGSFGSVAFYFKKAADVHSAFVSARGQVETVS